MTRQISDEALLADLQRVADAVGEPPTVQEFREQGQYADGTLRSRFGSWSAALEAAGLDASDSQRDIPDSTLVAEIQSVAEEVGQAPTMAQMDTHGERWASTYQDRFGSWNAALEAAGFEPRTKGSTSSKPVSTEALRTELQELAARLDKRPTRAEMDTDGEYAGSTYAKRFGSWREALEAAGLEPQPPTKRVETSELLQSLQDVAKAVGRPPTAAEYRAHGAYSASVLFDRFDSWGDALEAAGLDPEARQTRGEAQKIPKAELLDDIRRLASSADDPPTLAEYRDQGAYGAQTLYDRFGSWNTALEAAGFNSRPSAPEASEEALLDELHYLSEDGQPPTVTMMRSDGDYCVSTYQNHFGSWSAALEAAGFESSSPLKISRQELLTALQDLGSVLEDPPTVAEMAEQGRYSPHTYRQEFGSWKEALEAAGFESREPPAKLSETELLAEIRRLAETLGKRPTVREMNAEGAHASTTYQNRFGSWSEAVDLALDSEGQ